MKFVCPMHPEVRQEKKGKCPICGMTLVKENEIEKSKSSISTESKSYRPLFIIIGLILVCTIVLSFRDYVQGWFALNRSMAYFMSGFFLVFSGFKFLDLKGFADGYSTYDLLAKRFFVYGYIYPFIELILGLLFLTGVLPFLTNLITLLVMGFSGLGVLAAMQRKQSIQCACLGTIIKLPLTKVTLVEDFGMAGMAVLMLLTL